MSNKVQKKKKDSIVRDSSISTREPRRSKFSIPVEPTLVEQNPSDGSPKFLSTDCIVLRGEHQEKLLLKERHLIVPPSSPRDTIIFGEEIKSLPRSIPDVNNLKIPNVRVVGIRKCIEILGDFFGCKFYKTNVLQFWFLDIITDCLWRCQDEFLLTEEYQKTILGWVIYIFDIIRDPRKNFSRGQFIRFFREAMIVAEDRIEAGEILLPTPKKLFIIKPTTENQVEFDTLLSDSTDSSLVSEDSDSDKSYLVIPSNEHPELPDFYKLPKMYCKCDVSVSSSLDTLSEKSLYLADDEDDTSQKGDDLHYNSEADGNENMESYSVTDFYQPSKNIHSRFSEIMSVDDDDSSEEGPTIEDIKTDLQYEWVNEIEIPKHAQKRKSLATLNSYTLPEISDLSSLKKVKAVKSSKIKTGKKSNIDIGLSTQTIPIKKQASRIMKKEREPTEEEVLKAWFEYNIWEQRAKDMANPSRGWMPAQPIDCGDNCICGQIEYSPGDLENEEYLQMKNEWLQYLKKYKQSIDVKDQVKFVNCCLLLIIKQFVTEYFFESFQYKLIKMAFQIPPNLILEHLNSKWPIPKLCKDEFKRPANKRPKSKKKEKKKGHKKTKEKKGKGKKGKKSKRSKSSKSSKSTKRSKSSKNKSKKSRKSKEKLKKKQKLSKEEKAEIERVKREERKRIEEELAIEEHKRFIFPLNLSVEEQFFKNIFPNYVTLSKGAKKKKKKKEKKHK